VVFYYVAKAEKSMIQFNSVVNKIFFVVWLSAWLLCSKINIMNVLLLKPSPEADQFGLAPFFQTEPLGLEYIAAELQLRGHRTSIVDMRFDRRKLSRLLKIYTPKVIGIACLHIIDASSTISIADEIKKYDRSVCIIVGGHAASVYPEIFSSIISIDGICQGEGEKKFSDLIDAVEKGENINSVPSMLIQNNFDQSEQESKPECYLDLNDVKVPDRSKTTRYQNRYCCLNYMPVWTIETGRGCKHRCRFCSVWQFYNRTYRSHPPENVRKDFEATGHNIFIVDDIFWAEKDSSMELAKILKGSKERKNWILCQSRSDRVAENTDLLEKWRPLAKSFDIFFGFESPSKQGLNYLNKDLNVETTIEAMKVAKDLGFGITGNFIIDPDYTEEDFKQLWEFMDKYQLYRVGFTILTPLPGTHYFEELKNKILVTDWNQYDLHHLLWKPRLPQDRFWELYCETWRRSVLNLAGRKKWWTWLKGFKPHQTFRLAHILHRTQKLMDPKKYIKDSKLPKGQEF